MQKTILLSEARKLFPSFVPQWKAGHPDCPGEAGDIALGNPDFGIVRRVVIVETDDDGTPTRPLYDKWQIEEGPVHSNFPGTIVVPYFREGNQTFVIMRREERPTRGTNTLEFPQGLVEEGETPTETAARELFEETGLIALETRLLDEVCAEPDWFPRGTQVAMAKVNRPTADKDDLFVFCVSEGLNFTKGIDSATSLAALMRFLAAVR